MYRQIVIAAAAGLLSLAPLAITPAAAAAPRVSVTLTATTAPYGYRYQRPHLVCTPTYKRVTYRYHHRTYTRWVRTGQSCHWVYPSAPRPPGRRY